MIGELLRALPKSIRRDLMALSPPKIAEIVRDFQPAGASFLQDFATFLHRRYGAPVKAADWPAGALPAHLRPRINIIDPSGKVLGAGRDLAALQQRLQQARTEPAPPADSPAWTQACQQLERFGLADWTCGELPERLTISEGPGLPVYGWPALEYVDGSVNLRLSRTREPRPRRLPVRRPAPC